jgi:hypothetical protein
MTKDDIKIFSKDYYALCKELKSFILPRKNNYGIKTLYHYTSIEVFHNIIEKCEFWAHNTRFSNDYSEERAVLNQILTEKNYIGDNYFICLCDDGDLLSQWRGYCPNGGVSIGLSFPENEINFKILGNNTSKNLIFYSSPLQISYIEDNYDANFLYEIENKLIYLPLFKKSSFQEEKEYRILFNNKEHFLDKYIFERKLDNSTRVPFIKVKFNKVIDSHSIKKYFSPVNQEYEELIKRSKNVFGIHFLTIPESKRQENIYNAISTKLDEYYKKEGIPPKAKRNRITILCEGKPPITGIKIAPMYDQERVKEQIEHICKTRYWLRDVPVELSKIPLTFSLGRK